jgi:DNA-binding transcriptional ArsR family regulator
MPRRSYQQLFELAILSVLDKTIARNVEDIRRKVSEKLGKSVSWNTIKKYLITLRDAQKIEEVHIGKLVLYRLKG